MVKWVYIDTSVVGGQFDGEFSADTVPFFNSVTNGEFKILVSDLLEVELLRAPDRVRNFLLTMPSVSIERVALSAEAVTLADKYIDAKVVEKQAGPIANILQWQQLPVLMC